MMTNRLVTGVEVLTITQQMVGSDHVGCAHPPLTRWRFESSKGVSVSSSSKQKARPPLQG